MYLKSLHTIITITSTCKDRLCLTREQIISMPISRYGDNEQKLTVDIGHTRGQRTGMGGTGNEPDELPPVDVPLQPDAGGKQFSAEVELQT